MIRRSFFKSTGVFVIANYLNVFGWKSKKVNLSQFRPHEKELVRSFIDQMEIGLKDHPLKESLVSDYFEPKAINHREQDDHDFSLVITNKLGQKLTFSKKGKKDEFKINSSSLS